MYRAVEPGFLVVQPLKVYDLPPLLALDGVPGAEGAEPFFTLWVLKTLVPFMNLTVMVVALMAALSGLLLWAVSIDPADAPPIWFLGVILGLFAAVGIGVITALTQRIREIRKGEIDDAKKY